jgi:hypothetical protein
MHSPHPPPPGPSAPPPPCTNSWDVLAPLCTVWRGQLEFEFWPTSPLWQVGGLPSRRADVSGYLECTASGLHAECLRAGLALRVVAPHSAITISSAAAPPEPRHHALDSLNFRLPNGILLAAGGGRVGVLAAGKVGARLLNWFCREQSQKWSNHAAPAARHCSQLPGPGGLQLGMRGAGGYTSRFAAHTGRSWLWKGGLHKGGLGGPERGPTRPAGVAAGARGLGGRRCAASVAQQWARLGAANVWQVGNPCGAARWRTCSVRRTSPDSPNAWLSLDALHASVAGQGAQLWANSGGGKKEQSSTHFLPAAGRSGIGTASPVPALGREVCQASGHACAVHWRGWRWGGRYPPEWCSTRRQLTRPPPS